MGCLDTQPQLVAKNMSRPSACPVLLLTESSKLEADNQLLDLADEGAGATRVSE